MRNFDDALLVLNVGNLDGLLVDDRYLTVDELLLVHDRRLHLHHRRSHRDRRRGAEERVERRGVRRDRAHRTHAIPTVSTEHGHCGEIKRN